MHKSYHTPFDVNTYWVVCLILVCFVNNLILIHTVSPRFSTANRMSIVYARCARARTCCVFVISCCPFKANLICFFIVLFGFLECAQCDKIIPELSDYFINAIHSCPLSISRPQPTTVYCYCFICDYYYFWAVSCWFCVLICTLLLKLVCLSFVVISVCFFFPHSHTYIWHELTWIRSINLSYTSNFAGFFVFFVTYFKVIHRCWPYQMNLFFFL